MISFIWSLDPGLAWKDSSLLQPPNSCSLLPCTSFLSILGLFLVKLGSQIFLVPSVKAHTLHVAGGRQAKGEMFYIKSWTVGVDTIALGKHISQHWFILIRMVWGASGRKMLLWSLSVHTGANADRMADAESGLWDVWIFIITILVVIPSRESLGYEVLQEAGKQMKLSLALGLGSCSDQKTSLLPLNS